MKAEPFVQQGMIQTNSSCIPITKESEYRSLTFWSWLTFRCRRRRYWVQTLHVTTFSLSRNFFDRYRLRALIDELITTDPENTPVEKRNIDWLIQRYLAHIQPKDAHRRIITDPELEKDIYSEPRHLNHLPRARIRHFFAAQAEWLLAHMLASRSKQVKLLNIKQWIRFCHEARLDAIEAKKHGIRWGVSHGSTVDAKRSYDLSRNLAKFGHTPVFWKRRLEIVTEKKEKTSKVCFVGISAISSGSDRFYEYRHRAEFCLRKPMDLLLKRLNSNTTPTSANRPLQENQILEQMKNRMLLQFPIFIWRRRAFRMDVWHGPAHALAAISNSTSSTYRTWLGIFPNFD